jgi:hypothetical protein
MAVISGRQPDHQARCPTIRDMIDGQSYRKSSTLENSMDALVVQES